jgi:prevent-host-death family protein
MNRGGKMPKTMTATETRVHFGEVLRLVNEDCDHIVVERGGKPLAVILSVQQYEKLTETPEEDWLERARLSRERVAAWRGNKPLPDVDELINFGQR